MGRKGPAPSVHNILLVRRIGNALEAPSAIVLKAALASYERAQQCGQVPRPPLFRLLLSPLPLYLSPRAGKCRSLETKGAAVRTAHNQSAGRIEKFGLIVTWPYRR